MVLVGVYADSPAAAKVTNSGGPGSIFPCRYCVIESSSYEGPNKVHRYPAGYVEPIVMH